MSYQTIPTAEPSAPPGQQYIAAQAVRNPSTSPVLVRGDAISQYGGSVFWFVDVVARKLGRLLEELTDDDCTIILCGFFCQPCLIAQALEEVDENWWVTCCTVMFAPNLLGIPYMCFTAPAMNRLNERLGGEPMTFRNLVCLCLCRPCVACQLARAVKEAKANGRLERTPVLAPSAPVVERMERI